MIIKKKRNVVLCFVLSLVFVSMSFMTQPIFVNASDSQTFETFKKIQLKNVYPGINVIAKGYVQKNGKITSYVYNSNGDTAMSNVSAYALPAAMTSIQGVEIDDMYKPDNNAQKWQNYLESHGIYRPNTYFDKTCAYYETVTDPIDIVAYDESYVYYWSNGFRDTSPEFTMQCTSGNLNTVHVPGFYRLERKNVWIDLGKNRITGTEPSAVGTGTISYFAELLPEAGTSSTGAVWALGVNKTIDVISSTKVAANDNSGNTYYKVKFKNTSNGAAGYLGTMGIYYINSRFVNLRLKNENVPELLGAATVDTLTYSGINVRTEKSLTSTAIGLLGDGAKIDVISRGSEWTQVYYSGKVGYMQSKYLKNFKYVSFTDKVTKLKIKSFKKDNPVVTWTGKSNVCSYKVIVGPYNIMANTSATVKKKMTTMNKYKKTTFTVANKYFNSITANKTAYLYVYPQRKLSDGTIITSTTATRITLFKPKKYKLSTSSLQKVVNKLQYSVATSSGGAPKLYAEIKYSTKKNMKNAKTITKMKKNKLVISGLKKNKKYYFKRRFYYQYKIGKKTFKQYGEWSNTMNKIMK